MAKLLSQEEIDALLTSVSTGEEILTEPEDRQHKVTLYDFKHPNLISKEQMRMLENIHEGLVRNFSVYLSAQLRMIVDMDLLAVDQIMYSEFVMSINPPGAIYVGKINDPYSQIVLEINPQLAIFIVERLFGGQGSFIKDVRPVSQIEQKIVKRVIDRVSSEIAKQWKPISEFECQFDVFESNPEFVQIVPASEPVVVVSMEIKIHGCTTMMNICYPYMWISNIMSKPEIQEKILLGVHSSTESEQTDIKDSLDNTYITLKALLGKNMITINDFLNMKTGDVIKLDAELGSSRPVYINNKCLYNVTIGKSGKKYAFKVNTILTGENCYVD